MRKQSKSLFKSKLIGIAVLTFAIILLLLISNHPQFIEKFYTRGLYRGMCFLLHPIFNIFPFSIGDLLYILTTIAIGYAIVRFFIFVFRRQFNLLLGFLLRIVIVVQSAYVLFYLLWGLNYFRPPAAVILNLQDTSYTIANLQAVTAMLIDSANNCRARLKSTDLQQDNHTIFMFAGQAVVSLGDSSANFYIKAPRVKASILTLLLNYIGTSGYYNPFTSEAQVNYQMPLISRSFVACHEMSHQMGYAAEDEANFVGFLAGTHSKNALLRYSAYYLGMEEFLYALKHNDSVSYKHFRKDISPAVRIDLKEERNYWLAYQGRVEAISSVFYNNFLKANNQPYGLQTYNQMIRLAMAWYAKNGYYKTTPSVVNSKSP